MGFIAAGIGALFGGGGAAAAATGAAATAAGAGLVAGGGVAAGAAVATGAAVGAGVSVAGVVGTGLVLGGTAAAIDAASGPSTLETAGTFAKGANTILSGIRGAEALRSAGDKAAELGELGFQTHMRNVGLIEETAERKIARITAEGLDAQSGLKARIGGTGIVRESFRAILEEAEDVLARDVEEVQMQADIMTENERAAAERARIEGRAVERASDISAESSLLGTLGSAVTTGAEIFSLLK
ncbi:MAG: hypothetical protein KAR06_04690 [Deltaproteobacteria bacterium]|nr:hypothetical protein [Deltaproteobacteria bacterium]